MLHQAKRGMWEGFVWINTAIVPRWAPPGSIVSKIRNPDVGRLVGTDISLTDYVLVPQRSRFSSELAIDLFLHTLFLTLPKDSDPVKSGTMSTTNAPESHVDV